MSNTEGQSPLSFQSAVGKTKQPAALVRLENDYPQNPSNPMLYLRESALSHFLGHELVVAGTKYNWDIPRVRLGEPFRSQNLEPGPLRARA
ncbi:hypothetical protein RZS08_65970, partial [Arthrospira platensis SPKY1]|nr:hypothetical protein [Arthrospira platensis SPKY1]